MKLKKYVSAFIGLIILLSFIPIIPSKSLVQINTSSKQDPITIQVEVCDEDYDGISTFNLEEILLELSSQNNGNFTEDVIYIAESYDGLIKVENVSTNPSIINVCGTTRSLYEVAVDQNEDIYVSSRDGIYRVNTNNCNYQRLGGLPNNANIAMSFDTQNNLYVGGRTSKVYRANAGQFTNFYEWHDFGSGEAGGDFVVIDDFMYIAWAINNDNFLYRVTLDADNQFVSYENLGQIDDDTYGMAAENGVLYGVTPNYLYEIDIESMNTSRIIQNSSGTPWWGAAGLHEAIAYNYSIHETMEDALSGDNPLGDSFDNTTPDHQIVFIRVLNTNTGEVEIINLELIVNTPPETSPANLLGCAVNGNFGVFNLSDAIPDMINDSNGIDISYYLNETDAQNDANAIANINNFQSTQETQVIYVRFAAGDCESFNTITLENEASTLNMPSTFSICAGDEITIEAPTSFDTYSWDGLQGIDLINNDIHSDQITVSNAGFYVLTVTYGNGCNISQDIEVIEQDAPNFSDQTLNFCSENNGVTLTTIEIIDELNSIDSSLYYTLYESLNDAENEVNALSGNQTLTNGQTFIIQTKYSTTDDCYGLNTLTIELYPTPDFIWEDIYKICEGEDVTITIPDEFITYSWSGLQDVDEASNDITSNQVTITQEGLYTVEVANEHCSITKEVNVEFNPSANIQDVVIDGNNATVIAIGGDLEYSLDNINWNGNPTFTDLENGIYTAYIRSSSLCGTDQQDFTLFSLTNVITPNNDGYNDYWVVNGIRNYPDSKIQIYNRYGKLLVEQTLNSNFYWDGTYNGQKVPSGAYWYILQVSDGRSFTGHITVKNF